jgi:hypothetical protein
MISPVTEVCTDTEVQGAWALGTGYLGRTFRSQTEQAQAVKKAGMGEEGVQHAPFSGVEGMEKNEPGEVGGT